MLQTWQIKMKLTKFKVLCECAQCHSDFEVGLYDAKKSRIGHLCKKCTHRIVNLREFTQTSLLNLYEYTPVSGELRHKLDTIKGAKGDLATYLHSQGYLSVSIGGKDYLAHRIIWLMQIGVWPDQVDHLDHDRSNNRWSNLREVSSRLNQLNMSQKKSNTSGVTGVRVLPSGKYHAYIMVNRKQIALGSYDNIDDAKAARQAAEAKYGFHANHGI